MFGKETITISLKLFVITAIATLFLACVNLITKPVIADNSAKAETEALQRVLTNADSFKTTEAPQVDFAGVNVEKANIGFNGTDVAGYVFSVVSKEGYGGDIKVMVGVDKEFAVTRIEILESSETAGLGAKASEPEFAGQFEGAKGVLNVVKGKKAADGQISAISSATVTSKAVTKCVNAALQAAAKKNGEHTAEVIEETTKKLEEIKKETENQINNNQPEGGEKE